MLTSSVDVSVPCFQCSLENMVEARVCSVANLIYSFEVPTTWSSHPRHFDGCRGASICGEESARQCSGAMQQKCRPSLDADERRSFDVDVISLSDIDDLHPLPRLCLDRLCNVALKICSLRSRWRSPCTCSVQDVVSPWQGGHGPDSRDDGCHAHRK